MKTQQNFKRLIMMLGLAFVAGMAFIAGELAELSSASGQGIRSPTLFIALEDGRSVSGLLEGVIPVSSYGGGLIDLSRVAKGAGLRVGGQNVLWHQIALIAHSSDYEILIPEEILGLIGFVVGTRSGQVFQGRVAGNQSGVCPLFTAPPIPTRIEIRNVGSDGLRFTIWNGSTRVSDTGDLPPGKSFTYQGVITSIKCEDFDDAAEVIEYVITIL